MNTRPNARTNPCPAVGRKVGRRKSPFSLARERLLICPECQRTIAINYDGSLRWHKAEVRR